MREIITEILSVAIHAPSGHNSQPWKFGIKNKSVLIWNIPDKDKTLFNYRQRGSLIAHGALIENIFILASQKGYQTDIKLFPKKQKADLVAEISFKKTLKKYSFEYLSPYILKRSTNRKPYQAIQLKNKDKRKLKALSNSFKNEGFEIIFAQDREIIHQLSALLTVGDRLIFENSHIHRALFSNVNWTLKEEQKRREGLYVRTKELLPLERIVFKYILSNWNFVHALRHIGVSKKAALKRQKLYEQCSVIGLLTAPGDLPQDFVKAGRILQRFWLTTTLLGLSFQPISVGLLYLGQQIQREIPREITNDQAKLVREAYQGIIDIFNISEKIPTFSFRIGYADPPTATSLKKEAPLITSIAKS